MTEPEKFKLKDILYGLVIPIIIAIVILLFPTVIKNALDAAFPPPDMVAGTSGSDLAFLTIIFTHGFSMMICFAVPLILGLVWNKWAGGAAGFIMGTLYYVAFAGYNTFWSLLTFSELGPETALQFTQNLYADPSFIGNYIVGGVLIGYIAGALNNKSFSFKRMIGAGLTAAIAVGVMQFTLNITVAYGAWMALGNVFQAFYLVMIPMALLGIIAPLVAKLFMWFGVMPSGHY